MSISTPRASLASIDPDILALLRERQVCVAFSGGKDSIALWNALRRHGVPIVAAYYMELGPRLSFVERHLARCEEAYGVPIDRLPHWDTVRLLRNGILQSPRSYDRSQRLTRWTKDDIADWCRARSLTQVAGVRIHDSLPRRAAVRKGGAWNERFASAWPIWDWTKSQVLDEIRAGDVPLPVDYRLFVRSFDGIAHCVELAQHFPEDYGRMRIWYPMLYVERERRRRQGRC